jgi:HAE1 family hydrophobic/amphiphilic exporter-1
MESVVRFTLRQQVLFNLIFVLLMLVGLFAISDLPVERYPKINFGRVIVTTIYPGASPHDVEALVTVELEQAIEGLEEVEYVRATSARERSTITVKFRDDTDYQRLFDELRFRVLGALGELPAGIDPPRFQQIDTAAWLPVVSVNLIGERSNRALTLLAETLQVSLAGIPGVNEAEIVGELTREFHVALDPRQLAAHGITFEEVAAALSDANIMVPAGDYADDSGEFVVRVDERFRSREQVVSTVVRRDADGSFITVADLITSAGLSSRDPHEILSVNGIDTVAVRLSKSVNSNALEIMRAVENIIAGARPMLAAQGVELVLTEDSTTEIEESMTTLGWNMILGVALVGLILWYFMGPRNAGLVTIGIPFSFMVTMIIMWLTGNSLNEITLFSFVLVSGIIVDDAIVVTENIYRHLQNGKPLREAIIDGTAEVMLPVISATATTAAAFMPMLMMSGPTGEFFALVPKAVTFAIIASLFECLFILPLHYLDFGPGAKAAVDRDGRDEPMMRLLRRITSAVVGWTLRFRWLSLASIGIGFLAALAMLAVSIAGIAPLIRIQFFPDNYNLYYVLIEGPSNTAIETVDHRVRAIARAIVADGPGYARSAAGYAGFVIDENEERDAGHHLGTVMVTLPAKHERAFSDPVAHLETVRQRMVEQFQKDGFRISVRARMDGPQTGKEINLRIVGHDDDAVASLADALSKELAEDPQLGPQLIDFDDGRAPPVRVYRLQVDEPGARELGLTKGEAARLAAAVLDGRYIDKYRLSDAEVDFKLAIDPAALGTPEDALDILILEHASGPVRLGDILHPVPATQPSELERYRGQRSRSITANLRSDADASPAVVASWARERYAELKQRHLGASLMVGGEFEDTQRSFDSLLRAFALALLLIYLILAAQFQSYVQPILVLSAVMFSIMGVVFGTFLSQTLFTVNSFIAVVGVTGVVVNDSLVLIEFINRGYRSGMSRLDAINYGLDTRLRPMVLTTLTTTLGLLPMALGIPSYSLVWGSMASTFVTGLAVATTLTLFIVPVLWDVITEKQENAGS